MENRTAGDVLLYIPQFIGYLRVALFILALVEADVLRRVEEGGLTSRDRETGTLAVYKFVFFYIGSFVGDLFDGWAARKFNQTSKFGGVLDMVTDRLATCGVLGMLCARDPNWALYYIFFLLLDVASHWVHTIAAKGHHKEQKEDRGHNFQEPTAVRLLRWTINTYYGVYVFFGYCCVSAELMWVALVVGNFMHVSEHPLSDTVQLVITVVRPGMLVKHFINVCQLLLACFEIAACDADEFNAGTKSTNIGSSTSRSGSGSSRSKSATKGHVGDDAPATSPSRRSPRTRHRSRSRSRSRKNTNE